MGAQQLWQGLTGQKAPGDSSYINGGQADQEMFKSLSQYAPQAIQAIGQGVGGTAQSQLAAQQGVQAGYDKIGGDQVSLADKYQRQLDPEYYTQRGNVSDALNKYLSSYDPNKLSPTEEAQIARGIGATGGNLSGSQMDTVKNAQTFGAAGTERWKNFGDAVTKAASVIPSLKSGISGTTVANTGGGATAANAATNNALNANFGFSTSALGDIAGNKQAQIGKSKDYWDQLKAGSPSSILGGII